VGALHSNYDVVIIGGAVMGTSLAWHLACASEFDGRILVVERDASYEFAATARSNSCMRQQFSNAVNVRISQYGAEFVREFQGRVGGDAAIHTHHFGYLYLADEPGFAAHLQANQKLQASLGAATRILNPDQMAQQFPFFDLEGIILGSWGARDEGYFDGYAMFDGMRRAARRAGVEYLADEVVAINRQGGRIDSVALKSGGVIGCGAVVNAAGARGTQVAAMAGLDIPVEPRKRYIFVFDAQNPLDRPLPLTIDPSGVHMQSDGAHYMAGGAPPDDWAVEVDDFEVDHGLWEGHFWPAIATRVPAFEAVKVTNSWVGHYDYNLLDQNAIVGGHPEVANFYLMNGFSGHGLQQAPAMGRGVAELITHGGYRTLDMSELGVERVLSGMALRETAII
jgi:glycine/D-amino acid oxidase-like deaminating enzyme